MPKRQALRAQNTQQKGNQGLAEPSQLDSSRESLLMDFKQNLLTIQQCLKSTKRLKELDSPKTFKEIEKANKTLTSIIKRRDKKEIMKLKEKQQRNV